MAAVTAAKSSAFLSGSKTIVQAPRASARRVSFRFVALLGHFSNHISQEDLIFWLDQEIPDVLIYFICRLDRAGAPSP